MVSRHADTVSEVGCIVAIWRDRPNAPPFILPDGEAERYREVTRAQLRCVFADCPSPELTTVARRNSYHHFRHLSGTQHAAESLHHINSKAVLAHQISASRPDLQVEIEWAISTRRERVADVAVFDPQSARRYAFEIQYSPLSIDEWRARTRDYVDRDIEPTWLFGHSGANFRQPRSISSARNTVRLTRLQHAMSLDGGLVHWLNPVRRRIGTVVRGKNVKETTALLHIEPLESLEIKPEGVITPLWQLARTRLKERATWDSLSSQLTAKEIGELHKKREDTERAKKEAQLAQFSRDVAEMNARIQQRAAGAAEI